jgi:hypothetical protein
MNRTKGTQKNKTTLKSHFVSNYTHQTFAKVRKEMMKQGKSESTCVTVHLTVKTSLSSFHALGIAFPLSLRCLSRGRSCTRSQGSLSRLILAAKRFQPKTSFRIYFCVDECEVYNSVILLQ